jgi:hypothetical protein
LGENPCRDALEFFIEEIQDHMQILMVDLYANYFCQKLFAHMLPVDRMILLQKMVMHTLNISCNLRGTHAM